MNQRNTITIGRVVLHLLGREPVDVGSLEVELTIPGADVPVEKPVMADFPMSQPHPDLPDTKELNERIAADVRRAVQAPAFVTAVESMQAIEKAVGAPEPVEAPVNRKVPLDAANAESPMLADLVTMLRTVGGIKGTTQEIGDLVPQWQGRTAPSRQMCAYRWLNYIQAHAADFPDLTVTHSGKPIRWVVLVDGREHADAQKTQQDKLTAQQRKVYNRIRELLTDNVDALDGAVSEIVGKLHMSVRDLTPILRLLESLWLIEWSRVAGTDPDVDAFWRIDLLGGGAA